MNTKRLIIVCVLCAVCIALILGYGGLRSRVSGTQSRSGEHKTGSVSRTAINTIPQRSAAEAQAATAAHVSAIKETHRTADAIAKKALNAAKDDSDSSAAEKAEMIASEQEKKLLESITSLTEQLATNPELTTNAIALLQAEDDPAVMQLIAQAIGQAAARLGDKFPYDLLVKMALKDPSLPRRQAALQALAYMTSIPADLQASVAEISRTAPDPVRCSAIDCMTGWMSKNHGLTQTISEELLKTREASKDPTVRGLVIQNIGNMDTPLSSKVLTAMTDALMHEQEPNNRSLAAVALGSGSSSENAPSVLSALETAYVMEPDLVTQRHMITQIVKASRPKAEEVLKTLPTPDPQLAQDVQDYLEILKTVDQKDWGAIWDKKSQIDDQRGTYPTRPEGPESH